MDKNQNLRLFEQEHPLWNTYSDNDFRQAVIDFCIRHDIELPNKGIQEKTIPNQSIQQTHHGTIPPLTNDPPQDQSVKNLHKGLQDFMKKTKKHTSSQNQQNPQGQSHLLQY